MGQFNNDALTLVPSPSVAPKVELTFRVLVVSDYFTFFLEISQYAEKVIDFKGNNFMAQNLLFLTISKKGFYEKFIQDCLGIDWFGGFADQHKC
jgi:hypothetical protein